MSDPLQDLADMAKDYYDALRQRGIPQVLAERFAGDWHQAIVTAAATSDRPVQVAEQVTRQVVKGRRA